MNSQPDHRARRVLVVDDDPLVVQVMAKLLTSMGHIVEQAHDGVTALRLAGEFAPDVILLDLVMPGMDGLDVARHLRAARWVKRPGIFAVTAFGQQAFRDAAASAGFDGYITKPVSAQDLSAILDQ